MQKSKIRLNINQKLNGKRVGNNFDLSFESLATNKLNYKLNFNNIQSHPGLIYDIYQSDYDNISFNNNHKLSDIKSLDVKLYYDKTLIFPHSFSLIFSENGILFKKYNKIFFKLRYEN